MSKEICCLAQVAKERAFAVTTTLPKAITKAISEAVAKIFAEPAAQVSFKTWSKRPGRAHARKFDVVLQIRKLVVFELVLTVAGKRKAGSKDAEVGKKAKAGPTTQANCTSCLRCLC